MIGASAGRNSGISGNNVMIGNNAGEFTTFNIGYNVYIGQFAGSHDQGLGYSAYIGTFSGQNVLNGELNTYLGTYSGVNNSTGKYNLYLGAYSGENAAGNSCVFIGNNSGSNEDNDHKLIIENTANGPGQALIYGDFQSDDLELNADVTIRDLFKLTPQALPGGLGPGDAGVVVMDIFDSNILKVWDGTSWKNLW
jgi:hypothetical protein